MAKNIEINIKTSSGYETLYPENQCLKLSGGTVTGNLIVNGNTTVNGSLILPNSPVNGTDASNKSYVDGRYTAGNGISINDGVVSSDLNYISNNSIQQGWKFLGEFTFITDSSSTAYLTYGAMEVDKYNSYKITAEFSSGYYKRDEYTDIKNVNICNGCLFLFKNSKNKWEHYYRFIGSTYGPDSTWNGYLADYNSENYNENNVTEQTTKNIINITTPTYSQYKLRTTYWVWGKNTIYPS